MQPIEWFREARFGMMVHWGLYAIPAGEWRGERTDFLGEWLMSAFRIPVREYEQLAADFDPQGFDADEWVRLAKDAGMRYLVVTTKHHDGFAMYRSAVDPYNIYDATPFKRDPLAELAEACSRHGLALGVYYSQEQDWHEPEGGDPGPGYHKNFGLSWGNDWDFTDYTAKDFSRYFRHKALPQVRELLTNYGPICSIWFDNPIVITPQQSDELIDLVKSLQPRCLVNSRIGNDRGDYKSFGDNEVPSAPVTGAWETIATLNDTWGYKHFDAAWKSPHDLLGILTSLAAANTNYVLNIGPMADGRFPPESVRILLGLAAWSKVYGEAIHRTRESPFPYSQPWGVITARDGTESSTLYCCLRDTDRTSLTLGGVRNDVVRAYDLAQPSTTLQHTKTGESITIGLSEMITTASFPVIALELRGPINVDNGIQPQDGGAIDFPATLAIVHGEGLPPESLPKPAATGILTNWFDTRAWLEWSFSAPTKGAYRVEIVTSALHYNAKWEGGHRVRVEVGDTACEALIVDDEPVTTSETRYYRQAISHCGIVQIDAGGEHTLKLTALEIKPIQWVGLALVAVRLYPVS